MIIFYFLPSAHELMGTPRAVFTIYLFLLRQGLTTETHSVMKLSWNSQISVYLPALASQALEVKACAMTLSWLYF